MKTYIIILVVSAVVCITLGKDLLPKEQQCGVDIDAAIRSGGIEYVN